MKETEGYLQKLGVKLQKQKELARLENDFSESNPVLEVATELDAKDNTQVSKSFLLMKLFIQFQKVSDLLMSFLDLTVLLWFCTVQHYLESNENYYSQAHRWVILYDFISDASH